MFGEKEALKPPETLLSGPTFRAEDHEEIAGLGA